MNPDVDSFILVFDSFSRDQKIEAVNRLNEYINGSQGVKQQIVKESVRNRVHKVDVGPTSSVSCVCCGR